MTTTSEILLAVRKDDAFIIHEAKELLEEYGRYMYEELQLVAGKENFFSQLADFPGEGYVEPFGTFVVVKTGNAFIGCVGIKRFNEDSCEMKRMYIRPVHRGRGTGMKLCNYVIDWARKAGYNNILLDTNQEMREAVSLYLSCGFKEIPPYCINENAHPVFMKYML